MPSTAQTKTSTQRKLSEVKRHLVIPKGIVATGWPAVRDSAKNMGFRYDLWQVGLLMLILAKRASGLYAAGIGGVVISICRQVGKTFTIGSLIIILCILNPGMKVLWTAHRSRTSDETFKSMQGMARRKKIAPYVLHARLSNGQQEFEFHNGSRILFGARESGFGRGFEGVDIEIFDEAQILTQKALDDMVPATNTAKNPLIIFMGTPPKPTDPSEVFSEFRKLALSDQAEDMVYLEVSADEDAELEDRAQWAKANPSYPTRTPEHAILRMKRILNNDDSFRREGLGIWDAQDMSGVKIPSREWAKNLTLLPLPKLERTSDPVISVDMRTGLDQSLSIGFAVEVGEKDYAALAMYKAGVGQAWDLDFAVNEVKEVLARQKQDKVAIDSFGDGNGLLIPMLENAGIEVVKLGVQDMRNGAVGYVNGNLNGIILHGAPAQEDSDYLTAAVAGAAVRSSADGFLWSQPRSVVDIGPLRAVTVAWWVLHKSRSANYDIRDTFY